MLRVHYTLSITVALRIYYKELGPTFSTYTVCINDAIVIITRESLGDLYNIYRQRHSNMAPS